MGRLFSNIIGPRGVFHYNWRAPQMSFGGIVFLRVERICLNLQHIVKLKSNGGSASATLSHFWQIIPQTRHHGHTIYKHDDVIKWKHFPRYWPFMRGIHRSPVNSSHKGQWRGALMFSLICTRINGWVSNRETGDLRRHQAHCDVIVMNLQPHKNWFRELIKCDETPSELVAIKYICPISTINHLHIELFCWTRTHTS